MVVGGRYDKKEGKHILWERMVHLLKKAVPHTGDRFRSGSAVIAPSAKPVPPVTPTTHLASVAKLIRGAPPVHDGGASKTSRRTFQAWYQ